MIWTTAQETMAPTAPIIRTIPATPAKTTARTAARITARTTARTTAPKTAARTARTTTKEHAGGRIHFLPLFLSSAVRRKERFGVITLKLWVDKEKELAENTGNGVMK
jgi:hypothetical protein